MGNAPLMQIVDHTKKNLSEDKLEMVTSSSRNKQVILPSSFQQLQRNWQKNQLSEPAEISYLTDLVSLYACHVPRKPFFRPYLYNCKKRADNENFVGQNLYLLDTPFTWFSQGLVGLFNLLVSKGGCKNLMVVGPQRCFVKTKQRW